MPVKSNHVDIQVPVVDLWSFYMETPRQFPEDHAILIDSETGRSYNFAAIRELATEFGKGLRHVFKWNKGDTVGFYTPNNIDIPVLNLGVHWAGGIASPANPTYTVEELARQLKDSEAKVLLTQKPFLPAAVKAAELAGIPVDRVILLGDGRDETGVHRHWTQINAKDAWLQPKRALIDPKTDLAYLVYSSGTTGMPKGVMLNHYNMIANAVQSKDFDIQTMSWDRDTHLGVLPLFHIYGLGPVLHSTLHTGARLIMMAKFEIEKACKAIQDHKITFLYIPPPIVLALGKHPIVDKYDLSSLRWINSGAAPLSKELVTAVWERLRIGLADEFWKLQGSVGKLLPNMEAKIVDEEGKELKTGEAGELLLKGPNIFSGYWKRPDLNSETFTEDGWYRTGDVFYICPKGFFYITDRKKELIKYKGFQVPPAELEAKIIGREDVADVCVIGVWDKEQHTEIPRAYIVLKPGVEESDEKAKEIIQWLNGKVAPPKKLRGGVRFVKDIPKSQAGKILRRVLRDQVKAEEEAPRAKL
ncbi:putative 4-coumarate--CoA ligase 1 [Cladobotryum mycophilum]|uniref:4-coumarate--CoA ligase 1 n=1 Tax=Cladobotryum mycophilum TaxID=491253 RepID=A0ABR0S9X5_9HYPO